MKFCVWISAEVPPDWLSRLIMWKLSCDYSHIGIALINDEGEPHTIYHSVGEGFSTLTVKEFLSHGKILKGIKPVEIINPDKALGWLDGMLGKEYSEMQYLGFLLPRLQKLVDNGNRKLICSEAVARFLQAHMVGGFEKIKTADFASPKDVWEALNKES